MTTIKDLPEELLFSIFKEFQGVELMKLRLVCRRWFAPAHILYFQNVHLYSVEDINMFIDSFDFDPLQRYLKSVKSIKFYGLDEQNPDYTIDIDILEKVLLRFPNLDTVGFKNSSIMLKNFDDTISNAILKKCPKLSNFAINIEEEGDGDMCYDALCKARLLVTSLDLSPIRNNIKGTALQFLAGFPRLSSIYGESDQLNTLEKYLPVLEQLPSVSEFTISNAVQDRSEFAQHYLANEAFVQRLTGITALNWSFSNGISIASIMFIAQYLTGLQRLIFHCGLNKDTQGRQQRSFFEIAKNLLCTINICTIRLSMQLENISDTLHYFTSNKTHQTLYMILDSWFSIGEGINILEDSNKSIQEMEVCVKDELPLQQAASIIFKKNRPLKNIQEFVIKYRNHHSTQKITADMYDSLIQEMPSLKKITFDVPRLFQDNIDGLNETVFVHGNVEFLTVQGRPNQTIQSLLDRCFFMFPGLKQLHLLYYPGKWDSSFMEYQMDLQKYSLEKLVLDLTPIKMWANKQKLYAVKVDILQTKKRLIYKVVGETLSVTKITEKDLACLFIEADFRQIYLTIGNLQHFVLELYESEGANSFLDTQYRQKLTSRTLFKTK